MCFAAASASLIVSTGPSLQRATGTRDSSASRLASTLSPSTRITCESGPTNTMSSRSQSSAKSGCSATKPQPTHAASARLPTRARSRLA